MKKKDIHSKEYHPYYQVYIDLVPEGDTAEILSKQGEEIAAFFNNIPEDKQTFAYKEGKWTIKEILQHIIDTERIFTYRALRIGRNDSTPLAGYEHNDYVPHSRANRLDMATLIHDYKMVRQATISLLQSMDQEMLSKIGNANGNAMSSRVVFCIMVGHERHHTNIIKERYL